MQFPLSRRYGMGYWDRLQHLKILSLQRRRERYMIIHVWKILHEVVPNGTGLLFTEHTRLGTRAVVPPYSKIQIWPLRLIFWCKRRTALEFLALCSERAATSLLGRKKSLGSYLIQFLTNHQFVATGWSILTP